MPAPTRLRGSPARADAAGLGHRLGRGHPAPGTAYRLPGPPEPRAGLTVAARVSGLHLYDNRMWDDQGDKTQTHGVRITPEGTWTGGRVHGNDLRGNTSGDALLESQPREVRWPDDENGRGDKDGRDDENGRDDTDGRDDADGLGDADGRGDAGRG